MTTFLHTKAAAAEQMNSMTDAALLDEADRITESMTLKEKAAQMFIITPEALTGFSAVTQAGEATRIALNEYPVGGLIYMEQNILSAEQLSEMTGNIQEISCRLTGLPLFLCVDEEGGPVRRISGHIPSVPDIPDMWSVGQSADPDQAYEIGCEIGSYLSEFGLNVNFAPDADVVSDPLDSVIGVRSFGSDPGTVSDMTAAYVRGIQDQGVCAAIKHFPGHGTVTQDSHLSSVISYKTLKALEAEDLVPFVSGIDAGAAFVMAGHISFPAITKTRIPASLSRYFLTGLLREKMGYEGLIITDALNMGAVTDFCGPAEAAVVAVNAGADLLLMPEDFHLALQGLINSVQNGTIKEKRIDESVRRIIALKLNLLRGNTD